MRANGDMLAECWGRRDLRALLAQRFGMFAMEELAEELERKHDDVVRLTLGKSELPVHPAITEAMVDAVRDDPPVLLRAGVRERDRPAGRLFRGRILIRQAGLIP